MTNRRGRATPEPAMTALLEPTEALARVVLDIPTLRYVIECLELQARSYGGANLTIIGQPLERIAQNWRDLIDDSAHQEPDAVEGRVKALELMVADHPMAPARDPELNDLLGRASRSRGGRTNRARDWQRMEPIERAIRGCLIDVERLGAHRLLTDTVVLLERAQQRVAAWIDLRKPGAASVEPDADAPSMTRATANHIEQAAIYAWEAAPPHMVGCFRLWNEVPEKEKDEWRAIAHAILQAPEPGETP